jgi:plasmid stability protein
MTPAQPNRVPGVRPVVVRLPDETHAALKAEADRTGRSVSELVREAITLRALLAGKTLEAILDQLARERE